MENWGLGVEHVGFRLSWVTVQVSRMGVYIETVGFWLEHPQKHRPCQASLERLEASQTHHENA